MAIKIKSKDSNLDTLAKVGVSPVNLAFLEKKGVEVKLGFKDVKFVSGGGELLAHVPLHVTFTSMLKGSTGATDKLKALNSINAVIKGLQDSGKLTNVKSNPEPVAPVPMNTEHKLLTGEPVPLLSADRMYQPVKGSSGTSRYFLIGISGNLKIAARVKGTTVSLRAEGFDKQQKSQLLMAGFDNKGDSYLSVHVQSNAQATANKIVGAVLVGTGLQFETVVPDVEVIRGKGE